MNKPYSDNLPKYNTMILTGQAQVSSEPDIATVRLGVQTTGENLEQVQSENANKSNLVLQTITQMGALDIKTFQYLIEKIYTYENGTRIDKGYSIRNIFEIRLNNIEHVGSVIDAAVKNGANAVEFITFDISNVDIYYQRALNLAIKDAIHKAESISQQLGVWVNPIPIRITENSSFSIPFDQFNISREGGFATPIEPGLKRIVATVTAEFIY
ncbi:MAG: hypothetical protein K0R15_1552 [Clostridiales bacterium]|jgi:uncharacterized protein YggE|nr:hypothetical protein [Clostridiales bacterium]